MSVKENNDAPPGFKMTELGPLPEEWEVLTFKDLATTITDYVANGSFASLKENVKYKREEDYAILLRLSDYSNGFKGGFVYINKHAYDFLSKTKLRVNDIILANVGARLGTVFRVPDLNKPMSLGPNSLLIRTERSDDFLYYWLQSENGLAAIFSIASQTAQPKFNKTSLKYIDVPLPPLAEQKAIAYVLRTVQRAREATEAVIAAARDLKKTLVHYLFTYGPVPVTEAGQGTFKDTEFGLLPEGWEVVSLGSIAKIKYGKAKPKRLGGVPVIGSGGVYAWTDTALVEFPTLIIGRKGTAGKVWLEENGCWPSDTTFYLEWLEDNVADPYFVYQYMRLKPLSGEHAKTTLPSLTKPDLERYLLPLPPPAEQRKIAEMLYTIDGKIETEETRRAALDGLFKSLLAKLMTGKVRVPYDSGKGDGASVPT